MKYTPKKVLTYLMIITSCATFMTACSSKSQTGSDNNNNTSSTESILNENTSSEESSTESSGNKSITITTNDDKTVVGIAWRKDEDSEFYTNICKAVEEAGATWVKLDQVKCADLSYNGEGMLTAGVDDTGALDEISAKYIRNNTWYDSNAENAVGDVDIVLFTGGEDISPTLYYTPEEWHGIEEEKDYNAERDVSDYLTMSYCLDNDIPLMGFCRGMQMLSVISGAEVIQDIPTYFDELDLEYDYKHRNQKETPDSYRDYAPHEVVVEKNSLLYDIVGTELLKGCPSWHHQAVKNVDNTRLAVTGYTQTNGINIIEAVERTDKTFAVGLQFHPEAAVVKNLENFENKNDFMNYDTALSVFQWIANGEFIELKTAA